MQVNLYTVLPMLSLSLFGSFVVGLKATPLWVYQLASKRSFHILWHYNGTTTAVEPERATRIATPFYNTRRR